MYNYNSLITLYSSSLAIYVNYIFSELIFVIMIVSIYTLLRFRSTMQCSRKTHYIECFKLFVCEILKMAWIWYYKFSHSVVHIKLSLSLFVVTLHPFYDFFLSFLFYWCKFINVFPEHWTKRLSANLICNRRKKENDFR